MTEEEEPRLLRQEQIRMQLKDVSESTPFRLAFTDTDKDTASASGLQIRNIEPGSKRR